MLEGLDLTALAPIIFYVYLLLGLILVGFLLGRPKKSWSPPLTLSALPHSARTLITLMLAAYGLVFIFSAVEVYLKTRVSFSSAQEYFYYMNAAKLAATSHAHFFGHATMYGLTGFVFLWTTLKEGWKTAIIVLALSSGLLDVPSWWMIKYGGGRYDIVSAVSGVMSVAGWGTMAIRILYEMWFKPDSPVQ